MDAAVETLLSAFLVGKRYVNINLEELNDARTSLGTARAVGAGTVAFVELLYRYAADVVDLEWEMSDV